MSIRLPADKRREEIWKTALRLAFKVGPTQVTTGMIAKELGLTQPAIYKHFHSKIDILAEIARHLGECISHNTNQARALGDQPIARLRNLVLGHLQLLKENPALPEFMIMRDIKGDHLVLQDAIQNGMSVFRSALEAEVEGAVQAGQFRRGIAATDAATLVFGVIQSLVLRMLVTRNPDILAVDGARLLDLQLAGFLTNEDGK